MNLLKISQDIGVSVRQLKKVVKEFRRLGYLPPGDREDTAEITKMKNYLSIGANLPIPQLVRLIGHPELLKAMGAKAVGAKAQLEALGVVPTAHNTVITDLIFGTSSRVPGAVERLAAWMHATIPDHDVTHHYLAVRIAMATPDHLRPMLYPKLSYAFMLARTLPQMDGWFTVDRDRKRPTTFYHKPKNNL